MTKIKVKKVNGNHFKTSELPSSLKIYIRSLFRSHTKLFLSQSIKVFFKHKLKLEGLFKTTIIF